MGTIYRQAKHGLIWLGKFLEVPDKSKLDPLLWKYECRFKNGNDSRGRWDRKLNLDQLFFLNSELGDLIPVIRSLLSQHWFSRAWVFQEAVLARNSTVVCGSFNMSLDALGGIARDLYFLSKIRDFQEPPGIAFLRQATRLRDKAARIEPTEFYWYINLMSHCRASDPRDHVYAFLGLLDDKRSMSIPLQPDYNTTIVDVFTSTAKVIIESTGSLDLFCLLPHYDDSGLPSWVPNWSQEVDWNLMLGPVCYRSFKCSKGLKHTTASPSLPILTVKGRIIDEIIYIVSELCHEGEKQRYLLVEDQRRELVEVAQLTSYHELTRERILRTCFANVMSQTDLRDSDLEESRVTFETIKSGGQDPSTAKRKHIAFCKKKKLALVHNLSGTRDQIAVIHGSIVPIVLRRRHDGLYKVLGQCYYEDAMDGNAVTWKQDEADTLMLV
jgi:hypothetical protein